MKSLQIDYENKIETFHVKFIFSNFNYSNLIFFSHNYPMKKLEILFYNDMNQNIKKKLKDFQKNQLNMKMKILMDKVKLKHYQEKLMIK